MNGLQTFLRTATTLSLPALAVALGWIVLTVPPAEAQGYSVSIGGDEDDSAYLGVRLREETENSEGGARVTDVIDGSPAAEAGLEEGDIVVAFDGAVIRGPVGLTERIHGRDPGDRVSITVLRDGRRERIDVELGDRAVRTPQAWAWVQGDGPSYNFQLEGLGEGIQEQMEQLREQFGNNYQDWSQLRNLAPRIGAYWNKPKLGVELVETTRELRRHLGGTDDAGVLIGKVLSGMPAEQAGLQVGDLIVAVDGELVANTAELVDELRDKGGTTFPLEVVRDGKRRTLQVTIPEPDDSVPSGPRAMLSPPSFPARPAAPAPMLVPVPTARPAPPSAPSPPAAPRPPRPRDTSV